MINKIIIYGFWGCFAFVCCVGVWSIAYIVWYYRRSKTNKAERAKKIAARFKEDINERNKV